MIIYYLANLAALLAGALFISVMMYFPVSAVAERFNLTNEKILTCISAWIGIFFSTLILVADSNREIRDNDYIKVKEMKSQLAEDKRFDQTFKQYWQDKKITRFEFEKLKSLAKHIENEKDKVEIKKQAIEVKKEF